MPAGVKLFVALVILAVLVLGPTVILNLVYSTGHVRSLLIGKEVPGFLPARATGPTVPCSTSVNGQSDGLPYVCFASSTSSELFASPVLPTSEPTYGGGPLQKSPIVYMVDWGADPQLYASMVEFARAGINSPWSEALGAYGIGPGKVGGEFRDPDSPNHLFSQTEDPKADYSQDILTIASRAGWSLGPNTEVWIAVTYPLYSVGLAAICGFHDVVNSPNGAFDGTFAVVTDSGICPEDSAAVAHEYAESVTDPNTQDGYRGGGSILDPETEIGDVCVQAGNAVSPAGVVPMIYVPKFGCTWGTWAPAEVLKGSPPPPSLPAAWNTCSASVRCDGWLYYPPSEPRPAGNPFWRDPSGGSWVMVAGS